MGLLETAKRCLSILNMVATVCQRTGCVSVKFVEVVLPDQDGTHVDFQWLNKVLQTENVLAAGVHPMHQTANKVFMTALKRWTQKVSEFTVLSGQTGG